VISGFRLEVDEIRAHLV